MVDVDYSNECGYCMMSPAAPGKYVCTSCEVEMGGIRSAQIAEAEKEAEETRLEADHASAILEDIEREMVSRKMYFSTKERIEAMKVMFEAGREALAAWARLNSLKDN